ncbi:hypothetical protein [Corynebacterium halotolerans]|nr:hypothetical protein [Corynebacterium halotolerans]
MVSQGWLVFTITEDTSVGLLSAIIIFNIGMTPVMTPLPMDFCAHGSAIMNMPQRFDGAAVIAPVFMGPLPHIPKVVVESGSTTQETARWTSSLLSGHFATASAGTAAGQAM